MQQKPTQEQLMKEITTIAAFMVLVSAYVVCSLPQALLETSSVRSLEHVVPFKPPELAVMRVLTALVASVSLIGFGFVADQFDRRNLIAALLVIGGLSLGVLSIVLNFYVATAALCLATTCAAMIQSSILSDFASEDLMTSMAPLVGLFALGKFFGHVAFTSLIGHFLQQEKWLQACGYPALLLVVLALLVYIVVSPKPPTATSKLSLQQTYQVSVIRVLCAAFFIIHGVSVTMSIWNRVPYFEALMLEGMVFHKFSVYVFAGSVLASLSSGWTLHILFGDSTFVAVAVFVLIAAAGLFIFGRSATQEWANASMLTFGFGITAAKLMLVSAVLILIAAKKDNFAVNRNQFLNALFGAGFLSQAILQSLAPFPADIMAKELILSLLCIMVITAAVLIVYR